MSTARQNGDAGASVADESGISAATHPQTDQPGSGSPPSGEIGLRLRVVGGVRWKLVGQVSAQATSIATGILLAHLLTPHEFGLAGMALVFTGLGGVFSDLALSAALVQRSTLHEVDRSTAFWTNAAAGLLLTLTGVAAAPLVASFFGQGAVAPLFAASSGLFILWSLSATQAALLTREMNFRSIEVRNVLAGIVGGAVAVTLALMGAGAWTIVAQSIVTAAVALVLVWRLSAWRPRPTYSFASLRRLGSFSGKTLISQLLSYFTMNVDNILVGRFLGSGSLGIYSVSYNTMFLPVARISLPIQQVLFAAFSRLQREPERLRAAWLRGNQLISALNVPAFVGMAIVAPDFVPVVLGHRWHEAVPVLQLLSLAGVAQTLQTLNWSAVQALGRPGVMLRLRLFSTPLTLTAFAVGLYWGVVGVAALFAVVRYVITGVSSVVTSRVLRISLLASWRPEALVVALSLMMGVCVWLTRMLLVHEGVAPALRLGLLVCEGAVVYIGLMIWRAPDLLRELQSLMRRR
jgi:O-antigen/teichoic acid export membrane protein